MLEKPCSKCGNKKPLDAFCKHPRGLHNRASQCKDCDRLYRLQPMVREKIVVRDKLKSTRRKALGLRHNSPQYDRKYSAKQRELLSEGYLLGLIRARYGLSRQQIREHPTLLDAYKKRLEGRRILYRLDLYPILVPDKKAAKMFSDMKYKLARNLRQKPHHALAEKWRAKLSLLQSHPWFAFKPNGKSNPGN